MTSLLALSIAFLDANCEEKEGDLSYLFVEIIRAYNDKNAEAQEFYNNELFQYLIENPENFIETLSNQSQSIKERIYCEIQSPINDSINVQELNVLVNKVCKHYSFFSVRIRVLVSLIIAKEKYLKTS